MVCLPCKICKPHILPNVHFPFALLHILFRQDYFFISLVQGIRLFLLLFFKLVLHVKIQCVNMFNKALPYLVLFFFVFSILTELYLESSFYMPCNTQPVTSHEVWCKHLPFYNYYLKATILFFPFSCQNLDT